MFAESICNKTDSLLEIVKLIHVCVSYSFQPQEEKEIKHHGTSIARIHKILLCIVVTVYYAK